jgi:protein-disulfide isomerase
MPYSLFRSAPLIGLAAAAIAIGAACSRGDAAAKPLNGASAASPASAAPASGDVAAASSNGAQDSVSAKADRGRILGDSSAKVWLVMASDFQCPFCKQWHDSLFQGIVQKYVKSGRVRLAYLNMPLSIHQFSKPSAEAAMCASVQDKFWPMHDSLFATQKIWEKLQDPSTLFDTLANHNHVEMGSWRTCMSKHLTLPLIEADYDRARSTGVASTPTFFVGSIKLPGADADVAGALDAALAKAK